MLQSRRSQRSGHDLVTKQQQQDRGRILECVFFTTSQMIQKTLGPHLKKLCSRVLSKKRVWHIQGTDSRLVLENAGRPGIRMER